MSKFLTLVILPGRNSTTLSPRLSGDRFAPFTKRPELFEARAAAHCANVDIKRPSLNNHFLVRRGGFLDHSAIDEEGGVRAQTGQGLKMRGAARIHKLDEIARKALRAIVKDGEGERALVAAIFHEPIERQRQKPADAKWSSAR